jgi:hypothetical protein
MGKLVIFWWWDRQPLAAQINSKTPENVSHAAGMVKQAIKTG